MRILLLIKVLYITVPYFRKPPYTVAIITDTALLESSEFESKLIKAVGYVEQLRSTSNLYG